MSKLFSTCHDSSIQHWAVELFLWQRLESETIFRRTSHLHHHFRHLRANWRHNFSSGRTIEIEADVWCTLFDFVTCPWSPSDLCHVNRIVIIIIIIIISRRPVTWHSDIEMPDDTDYAGSCRRQCRRLSDGEELTAYIPIRSFRRLFVFSRVVNKCEHFLLTPSLCIIYSHT